MKLVTAGDVAKELINEVGLDPEILGIESPEVLCALTRRAAGMLCPCTKKKLLNNILSCLDGVVPDPIALRKVVSQTIDSLVAHGDLLEHNDITSDSSRMEVIVNKAPLAFVKRQSGACVILGVTPDDKPYLPEALYEKIQYNNYNRIIPNDASANLSEQLAGLGLVELSHKAWLAFPAIKTAEKHIEEMTHHLYTSLGHATTHVEGLRILDYSTPVDFYPDRWVNPKGQTGRFVGRRPQAYGSDLWCYVELEGGKPKRFMDLPLSGSPWRGCDEAWYLQAAIDACNGKHQKYSIRQGVFNHTILDLYSPIPSWAQRRWVMAGMSVPPLRCLLSFSFQSSEMSEEIAFAQEHLWLAEK